MKPPKQAELDFGIARQGRIGRALRASPAVSRAVPLADMDKLLLACMDTLAQQVAAEAQALSPADKAGYAAKRVRQFIASLGEVSREFAHETERYLNEAIARAQQQQ